MQGFFVQLPPCGIAKPSLLAVRSLCIILNFSFSQTTPMSKLETSKTSGIHLQLSKLAGNWAGTSKVWFEPGDPVDTAEVTGTMKLIMNGKYILHEYKSAFQGKPLEGIAIYAYNLDLNKYEMAWIDSFHTGTFIMFSEGKRNTDEFKMLGSYAYVTPETEQHWGWRTEINMTSDDDVVITAYNISPEGEESKATEFVYKRQA